MDLGQGAAALELHWSFPCQQHGRKRFSVTDNTIHVRSDWRVCGRLFYSLMCTGHIFPQLARGQAYNTWLMCGASHMWCTMWISQLPCWLIYCIARQTHKLCAQEPWRCIQTFLYVWAPFLTVFWRRLEIIFRPMEIHWRTLGCYFCCMEQIPNIAHRQKKTIILPSRFLLSSLNLGKSKVQFPRHGFAIQQHLFSSHYKPSQDTVSWDWVVIV